MLGNFILQHGVCSSIILIIFQSLLYIEQWWLKLKYNSSLASFNPWAADAGATSPYPPDLTQRPPVVSVVNISVH